MLLPFFLCSSCISLLFAFLRGREKTYNIFVNVSTENWERNKRSPTIGNPVSLLIDK